MTSPYTELGRLIAQKRSSSNDVDLDARIEAAIARVKTAKATRKQATVDEFPWFRAAEPAPCRGDCPGCWTIPVYLADDASPALDRYVQPAWANFYKPEGVP